MESLSDSLVVQRLPEELNNKFRVNISFFKTNNDFSHLFIDVMGGVVRKRQLNWFPLSSFHRPMRDTSMQNPLTVDALSGINNVNCAPFEGGCIRLTSAFNSTQVRRVASEESTKAGCDFEIVERAIPNPAAGQVRVEVQACGVCHSDVLTKEGQWSGIQYPRIPGHEIAGVIDEVGAGVSTWKKGQRV